MANQHPAYVHSNPAPAGLGVVPVIWAAAIGAGALAILGKEQLEKFVQWTKDVGNPGTLDLPSSVVMTPPAAPVTRAEMTAPGAFTPEEMWLRTTDIQRATQQAFSQGSAAGFQVGSGQNIGAPRTVTPAQEDLAKERMLWTAAIVLGGVVVFAAMSGKKR